MLVEAKPPKGFQVFLPILNPVSDAEILAPELVGDIKMHRRFHIGLPKIHRRFRTGPPPVTLNLLLPELHSR